VSLRIELGRSYQRGSVKGLVADDGDAVGGGVEINASCI